MENKAKPITCCPIIPIGAPMALLSTQNHHDKLEKKHASLFFFLTLFTIYTFTRLQTAVHLVIFTTHQILGFVEDCEILNTNI